MGGDEAGPRFKVVTPGGYPYLVDTRQAPVEKDLDGRAILTYSGGRDNELEELAVALNRIDHPSLISPALLVTLEELVKKARAYGEKHEPGVYGTVTFRPRLSTRGGS